MEVNCCKKCNNCGRYIQNRILSSLRQAESPGITGNEYDKKVQELKARDRDILEQLKDHSKWDEAFLITSSYILELAHRAYELFKSSQTSKKRELINFVFANFEADGSKLAFKTKEPFNELLFCAKSWKWLRVIEEVRTAIIEGGNFHLNSHITQYNNYHLFQI